MRIGQSVALLALLVSPAVADDVIIKSPNMPTEPQYEARPLSRDAREDLKAAGRQEPAPKTDAPRGDRRDALPPEKPM